MNWIKKFLQTVAGKETTDWTFIEDIGADDAADEPVTPDECYVELYVESFKLSHERKFLTTFDGVVYAFIETSRKGEKPAKLSAVTKPQEISQIGTAELNKIITVNKRLFKVIPWRGNPLDLELGLFSVNSGNVASNIADYVVRLSNTISPGLTGSIDPFLPLVSEGLDLLAGQSDDVELELAINTSLELNKSKKYALVQAPAKSVDKNNYSLSSEQGLLYKNEKVNDSYCVFSIRARADNPDWGAIESIRTSFANLKKAISGGEKSEADDALAGFRQQVLICPDLIYNDQLKLIKEAKNLVSLAFDSSITAGKLQVVDFEKLELDSLALYD